MRRVPGFTVADGRLIRLARIRDVRAVAGTHGAAGVFLDLVDGDRPVLVATYPRLADAELTAARMRRHL